MTHYLAGIRDSLLPGKLFPEQPLISFAPQQTQCSCCGQQSRSLKTKKRKIAALSIGHFIAHEALRYCPSCDDQPIIVSEELRQIVPPGGCYAYDVIVTVGQAMFVQCCSTKEIQSQLGEKNINISLREIDYLGQRFIVYLALIHEQSQKKLKALLGLRGGYILHLDGTCEGDSPHLMTSIDGLSKIVLGNVKLPSENADQLIPFLNNIKQAYGNPIAMVHDMGSAILNAIKAVFPNIPDFICHFHFLKDIGKDLFGQEYGTIRRHLTTHAIRTQLRKSAKGLKQAINVDSEKLEFLEAYLKSKSLHQPLMPLPPVVIAYLVITWVLEAKQDSHGFGFPFDRPHFDFYCRLKEAYPDLQRMKAKWTDQAGLLPLASIRKVLIDQALETTVLRMRDKIQTFDQLRHAMRIAQPDSPDGLNDEGDVNIFTIKQRVTEFRQSPQIKELAGTSTAYRKMVKQIDKYWDKLFADAIIVDTKDGTISIQPQRTNNILEQFFREIKRRGRKRSGNLSLSKTLKTMIAQTPLVKNLDNPQYMEVVLNGKANLAERFADIEITIVRGSHTEAQETTQCYPKRMAEVFKIPHLPQKLINSTEKIAETA